EVATAIDRATRDDAVLDGEVCALDERGRPSFSAMQTGTGRLVYYAFDCPEARGEPPLDKALQERRPRPAHPVRARAAGLLSEAFDDGRALLEAVTGQGLEGIVAKRRGSSYAQGRRTRDWLKFKATARQEFVIAGYTRGSGNRASTFGSLVLAVNDGGELL